MSDMELPFEGEAEIGSGEAGEIGSEAVSEDVVTEPEYDYLEIDDDLANKYVKVKVDGEELSVPLNEALQGFSRTQDYTRKTQEAAELRRQADAALQLQEALFTSPGLTIQVLAQRAGVSVEEFLGMTPAQQQAAVEEPEYADPLERELAREREARLALEARFEAREADEALARAVGGLKQQFGASDDQARAVVNQAMKMNLGFEAFPLIYQAMAYQAQQAAAAQVAAGSEADVARRRQAAATASQVVSAGTGAAGTTEVAPATKYTSIREAAAAAIDELESGRR